MVCLRSLIIPFNILPTTHPPPPYYVPERHEGRVTKIFVSLQDFLVDNFFVLACSGRGTTESTFTVPFISINRGERSQVSFIKNSIPSDMVCLLTVVN